MLKRTYDIRIEEDVLFCNCGEELIKGDAIYTSSPPQLDFFCIKCGFSKRIPQKEWPRLRYVRKECVRTEGIE